RHTGPMILAGPKLEQPSGRDEGRHCCTVHARHALLQVVDANHALIERALKLYPVLRYAHVIEPRRQPIIGAIARLDLFASTAAERPLVLRDPRLDPIEPVVAL